MDAFKTEDRNDPTVAIKTHDDLNAELLQTRDSTHHGYVLLAKTDSRLIVAHRLSQYQPGLGMPVEGWHQKLFAFTGDVFENQMPQTILWPTRALEELTTATRVAKLNTQIADLMNDGTITLPPIVVGATADTYDEIPTRYSMYVPGKYLPILLARRMTPKEALLAINAEAVTQNEQDLMKPLIDWLRVAVTRTGVNDTTFSTVARTLPPTILLADAEFSRKQKAMAERDLPGWNSTNVASQQGGGNQNQYQGYSNGQGNPAQTVILQSLQLLLQQSQTQGTITSARRIKKPSERWEGTIDLLMRLTGVATESDLPPIWDAWANCNKKEARTVLQEHLRDNARILGLPEPVATGELTTMLTTLAFNSMHEDDLETGLQPFIVSYKDQQTIAKQQRVNKDYDMVQQGAAPQLQDLYALKEASKISVPNSEQQMVRTLKAYTVLLYTVVGPTHPLYLATKRDLVDQYDTYQPLVETYVASLRGQPVYTQMVRWVQLRCNAYWNLVVRSSTGSTRAPDFSALYNDIQYKQWNRPSIPKQYLSDTKAAGGSPALNESGGSAGQTFPKKAPAAPQSKKTNNDPPDRLRNSNFDDEVLRPLGVRIGRVALFLKKIAPAGKHMAVPPKNSAGAVLCLNWHTKGHCWSHCDHKKAHTELGSDEKTQLIQFLEAGLEKIE
jgi:hypothetical protein